MQQNNILPLPSPRQIQRYLKKMKPAYGFQDATFDLLAKKAKEMGVDERHGNSFPISIIGKLHILTNKMCT